MTICKISKGKIYHFATLCIKITPIRYKSSNLSFVCTHTNLLTYIKGEPIAHFKEKALEVSANIRIFVQAKMSQPMKDYPDRMTPEQARTFRDAVLNIVSQIPCGRVTTYGHIAALTGWPSHSRMVGRTLRYTPEAESLPCHRVVNKEGRTAPGWSRQRPLLEGEGVHFKSNGHVDMSRHLWEPEMEL